MKTYFVWLNGAASAAVGYVIASSICRACTKLGVEGYDEGCGLWLMGFDPWIEVCFVEYKKDTDVIDLSTLEETISAEQLNHIAIKFKREIEGECV